MPRTIDSQAIPIRADILFLYSVFRLSRTGIAAQN